ncbi:MAG: 3-keto-disaccharide hydrolase [Chitinophagaceae bacterium]
MKSKFINACLLLSVLCVISCNNSISKMQSDTGKTISLFDGKSLSGWHGFNKTGEIKNWAIEDGAMVCLGAARDAAGGDIVSDKQFENFELNWEWKMSKGGNSGVMYHVIESDKYKSPYETGPEYQMIDDIGVPDKLEEWQKTGADYAMYTANEKKNVKPLGEWNTSKIIFNKGHVEHWLNGEKIVEFEAWSDDWKKKRTEGKWKDFSDYGTAKKGGIALQDHGNKAWFKNITIREL